MHTKALHPGANRPYEPTNTSADELQHRVVDFAHDILALWDDVAAEKAMAAHRDTMTDSRAYAVEEARRSADWFGIPPVFT